MDETDVILKIEEILKYTDEKLYLYHLNKIISVTRNDKLLSLLDMVKGELEKSYADISPDGITMSEIWTTGINLFPLDAFDYTSILYYETRLLVKRYVRNEILKKQLFEILYLPINYKNGQKSKFHKHSSTYRDFLNSRKIHLETIERIKNECNIQ